MHAGKTMRGRRDDEDDDRPLSPTGRGHTTRGIFLDFSRAFLSSGVPERAPEGRGWRGLAGWMKAQIRAKTRIRGRDWADLHRPDEKKMSTGSLVGRVNGDALNPLRLTFMYFWVWICSLLVLYMECMYVVKDVNEQARMSQASLWWNKV
jgi:hypothetical protein